MGAPASAYVGLVNSPRILIVEDNPADVGLIRALLSEIHSLSYQLEPVACLSEALTRLQCKDIDLVLLDLGLPDSVGLATLHQVRTAAPDVPVIVLTGIQDEDLGISAMRDGAQDMLVKGQLNGHQTNRAIRYTLERIQAQKGLAASQRLLVEVSEIGKVGGWEFNIDSGKQQWTEQTYRIHEVDSSYEPTLEMGINFYTPASKPIIERAIEQIIEHGTAFNEELEMFTAQGNLRTVLVIGRADLKHRRIYGFIQDITARKLVEASLRENSELLNESQFVAGLGSYVLDVSTGRWSSSAVQDQIFGIDASYERSIESWSNLVHPADRQMMIEYFRDEVLGRRALFGKEYRIVRHQDQAERWIHGRGRLEFDANGQPIKMLGTIQDISERKQTEIYHEMDREVLTTFNETSDLLDSMQRTVDVLKSGTGFAAVGIRMSNEEDFPYLVQVGFPEEFLLTENSLTKRDANGGLCRDCHGKPYLECLCGQVLSGQTDSLAQYMSQGGSFWTNHSFPLPEPGPTCAPGHRPRYHCIQLGYASMALVPIRAGRQIIGLLQLNDHRQGRFTDAIIAQLENIAAHIGGAVMRQQIEAALRVSLHEKESLLSEVHHRVKNNLQIISSLLRLQSGRINNSIAKAALLDMQNRIHSMALVHESLYDSASFAAVDFATYLRNLCNRLFRALVSAPDTIQLHLNIAPAHLDITRAIPCGLLVNELVTNALKHAFPQQRNGELRVELLQLDDSSHWRLRVADNGVGMPPDFDPNNLSSMGLKLVSDLSHQLGAQLKIGPGPGAVFEIDFPMPSK